MMQMCIFRPLSAQVIHSSMTFCQQRQQGALLYAAHFLRLLGVVLARNPCLMADTVRLALQLRQLIEKRRVLGSLFRSVSRLPQTLHPTYSADNGHMHKGMSEMKMGKKREQKTYRLTNVLLEHDFHVLGAEDALDDETVLRIDGACRTQFGIEIGYHVIRISANAVSIT